MQSEILRVVNIKVMFSEVAPCDFVDRHVYRRFRQVCPKCRYVSTKIHGAVFQRTVILRRYTEIQNSVNVLKSPPGHLNPICLRCSLPSTHTFSMELQLYFVRTSCFTNCTKGTFIVDLGPPTSLSEFESYFKYINYILYLFCNITCRSNYGIICMVIRFCQPISSTTNNTAHHLCTACVLMISLELCKQGQFFLYPLQNISGTIKCARVIQLKIRNFRKKNNR
jgi:hypothetical protein